MVRVLAFATVLLMPAMLGSAASTSPDVLASSDQLALAKTPPLRARGAEAASHLALPGQKKRKPITLLA